ncbi:MAG: hypothetical protein H6624_01575 [Bdellovibrionaceae bacterium]|nr:hypothetical protein [Bdellovibrionales bacterium]MCB9082997.1 hypothetical protein [Pseudobdellovibrionaceae bacterium]
MTSLPRYLVFLAFAFSLGSAAKTGVPQETQSSPYTYVDPKVGYLPLPLVKTEVHKVVANETVYKVTYSFGQFGERLTPSVVESPQVHLTVFGGSLGFGEGVNDNETILFHLVKNNPKVMPYNFAFRGQGPNSFLARLEFTNVLKDMSPTKGTFVYLHAPFHYRRAYGYSNVIGLWGRNTPHYEITDTGELRYSGLFSESKPYLTQFYSWFAQLDLVQRLGLYFPIFAEGRARDLTCRIIARIEELIKRDQPQSQLIVVTLPRQSHAELPRCLTDGTHVHHDLRKSYPPHDLERMEIPLDGHYNPWGNQVLGDTIRPLLGEIQ